MAFVRHSADILRKTLAAIAFAAVFACLWLFALACEDNAAPAYIGTYYMYSAGYTDDVVLELRVDGYKLTVRKSGSDFSGRYGVDGKDLTLYNGSGGEQTEFMKMRMSNGVISAELMGSRVFLCKRGYTPADGDLAPDGAYFLYSDGKLMLTEYIALFNDNKFVMSTESTLTYGRFDTVSFSVRFYDSYNELFMTAVTNNGVMRVTVSGNTMYFCQNGRTPEDF